ncbi:MAG: hypothetical protein GY711_30155 [bacterium]|nr:hypothetical protein [bacterium]
MFSARLCSMGFVLTLLLATGVRAQVPTCPGCDDASPPPPAIPSVSLIGVSGLFGGPDDFGLVSFTATFLRKDDGRCWMPNYDQVGFSHQFFCVEEFPCVYELKVDAIFTAGADHVSGHSAHVTTAGAACGASQGGATFLSATGGATEVLRVLFSAGCGQGCGYAFSFSVGYGSTTPPHEFKVLDPNTPTTTNLVGAVACDPCP